MTFWGQHGMQYVSEAWREYQRHQFIRQDGHRFRHTNYDVFYGRKYSPDRPRASATRPAGGMDSGGGERLVFVRINDLRHR